MKRLLLASVLLISLGNAAFAGDEQSSSAAPKTEVPVQAQPVPVQAQPVPVPVVPATNPAQAQQQPANDKGAETEIQPAAK